MFTVHYQINGLFESYRKFSSLAEARKFAGGLRDTIYIDITDGDKQYELTAPTLN